MIYTLILKPRFGNIVKALVFIVVISFSATLYSCQTVYMEEFNPEKLKENEDIKILEVTTKTDSTIYLSDCNVIYKKSYKDSLSILLVDKAEAIYSQYLGQPDTYRLKRNLTEINLKDIKNIKVEKKSSI